MWVNNCFDVFMFAVFLFYWPVRLRFEYLGVVSLRENCF
jgi:hypothetical protein